MHGVIKIAINAKGSRWHPLMAHHTCYIHHVVSNFVVTFKSKTAKQALMNAAYAKTRWEYLYYHGLLRDENPTMCEWIDRISIEKWAQHADEGCSFEHMTTNLSECINDVLKGIQNLPIMALLTSTYFWLVELFVRKREGGWGQTYSRTIPGLSMSDQGE